MQLPFAGTRAIESQVDEFLDIIVKGILTLQQAIADYLQDQREGFASRIAQVSDLEHQADDICKRTETVLYTHSLIPESRGDVLSLLENMDNIIDRAKEVLQRFRIERPSIAPELHDLFTKLTESTVHSVDEVVGAARAYFRDTSRVRDFINKVDFYEKEADRTGLSLRQQIFASDIHLSNKLHLRYFAEQIESISDIAKEVGEGLAIAALKRSL